MVCIQKHAYSKGTLFQWVWGRGGGDVSTGIISALTFCQVIVSFGPFLYKFGAYRTSSAHIYLIIVGFMLSHASNNYCPLISRQSSIPFKMFQHNFKASPVIGRASIF